jgi:hypothetical protein
MARHTQHRLWITGVTILALCAFLTGTSVACFQRGGADSRMAEDCCRGHCQHAMVGKTAAECCQSHQTTGSQVLTTSPSAKVRVLIASALHGWLLPPPALQGTEQSLVRLSMAERPPPFPPLYTLHCTLLL